MKSQRYILAISCTLTVLGFAQTPIHAASILGSMHESFDYPDTTQFINSSTLNGGQGWNISGDLDPNAAAANWGGAAAGLNGGNPLYRTATAPGLSYAAPGYLPSSGNKLTLDALTPNANQNVGRNLGGQTIDSGTTYFSLLMSKNNDTPRTINWAFFNGGTERFAIGQIGATAGNSGGNIALLMNNSNPAGLIQGANPIAMGVGITHLLIGRIDWNSSGFETVTLWVDPTDVTSEGLAGAAYASTGAFELNAITAVRPFVGNNATVGGVAVLGASANFDEFRLGGTWGSVTSLAVVPEPTSATLLGLGALSLLALRRRIGR
jgi:hypothetical protein